MTDLTKLEALARAATPGEWVAEQPEHEDHMEGYVISKIGENEYTIAQLEYWGGKGEANAAYIAAANPAAILALIERVRTAEERIQRCVTMLDEKYPGEELPSVDIAEVWNAVMDILT